MTGFLYLGGINLNISNAYVRPTTITGGTGYSSTNKWNSSQNQSVDTTNPSTNGVTKTTNATTSSSKVSTASLLSYLQQMSDMNTLVNGLNNSDGTTNTNEAMSNALSNSLGLNSTNYANVLSDLTATNSNSTSSTSAANSSSSSTDSFTQLAQLFTSGLNGNTLYPFLNTTSLLSGLGLNTTNTNNTTAQYTTQNPILSSLLNVQV